MCDLDATETGYIVDTLHEIGALADQLRTHATSIGETAFMDHEALAALLGSVKEKVSTAEKWVVAKPHEHMSH